MLCRVKPRLVFGIAIVEFTKPEFNSAPLQDGEHLNESRSTRKVVGLVCALSAKCGCLAYASKKTRGSGPSPKQPCLKQSKSWGTSELAG